MGELHEEHRALVLGLALSRFLGVAADCLPRLTAAVEALAGTDQQSTATRVARKLSHLGSTFTTRKELQALTRVRAALIHAVERGWVDLDDFEIARPDFQRLRGIGPKTAELLMQGRRPAAHDE